MKCHLVGLVSLSMWGGAIRSSDAFGITMRAGLQRSEVMLQAAQVLGNVAILKRGIATGSIPPTVWEEFFTKINEERQYALSPEARDHLHTLELLDEGGSIPPFVWTLIKLTSTTRIPAL